MTDGLASKGSGAGARVAEHEIHVWRFGLEPPVRVVDALRDLLAEDEQARAGRFYFDKHRRRFIVGRAVLRRLLGMYLDLEPQAVAFGYGPKGKPFVLDGAVPDLEFNLTHTDDLALLAVTRGRAIGVDIEMRREVPEALGIARRFFTADEVDWLKDHDPGRRSDAFLTLWTRKEAYIKAIGDGLSCPLNRIDVWESENGSGRVFEPEKSGPLERPWRFWDLGVGDGHLAALAVPEGPAVFRSRSWRPAESDGDESDALGLCGPADAVWPPPAAEEPSGTVVEDL